MKSRACLFLFLIQLMCWAVAHNNLCSLWVSVEIPFAWDFRWYLLPENLFYFSRIRASIVPIHIHRVYRLKLEVWYHSNALLFQKIHPHRVRHEDELKINNFISRLLSYEWNQCCFIVSEGALSMWHNCSWVLMVAQNDEIDQKMRTQKRNV